jgi:hypothetical protein
MKKHTRRSYTLSNWVSINDQTFVIGDDQYVGLGSVRFTVMQDVIGGVEALKDVIGVFEPKDDESASKISDAFILNKEIEIRGSFRDTLSGNKESDWRLARVLFTQIKSGELASFRAVTSEYPLGTLTRR